MEKGFHGRVPLHHTSLSEGGPLSVVKYFVDEQEVDINTQGKAKTSITEQKM